MSALLGKPCLALLTAGALMAPVALAQTAGQTLQQAVPRAPDPERAPLPATVAPGGAAAAAGAPGEARFTLTGVTLAGDAVPPGVEAEPAWRDLLGTEIGAAEATAAAAALQAAIRNAGFVFTRVLPSTDPEAGRLTLTVVEARIEGVVIEEPEGAVGPVRALLERLAAPLVGLRNPRLADLERVLLLLNDVPGVTRATGVPRAGEGGPGALVLSVNVERDPFVGIAFADTRQQPSFGEGLLGAQVEFGGYGAGGDTTSLTGSVSFWDSWADLDERQILQLEQSRFIGGDGARVSGRVLYGRNRPGAELKDLDLQGEDWEFELAAEYPVIRTRPLSLWARGGLTFYETSLDISGGATRITDEARRVLFAEAEALVRDRYGFTVATLGLRQGLDAFGAAETGDLTNTRFDGRPDATISYGEIEREQGLGKLGGGDVALFGRAGGQFASDPLLGGEEFALGGTTFGRGYDPSELLGDHGAAVTLELRWRRRFFVQGEAVQTELYGFGEGGAVWNIGAGGTGQEDLSAFGVGLRAFLPRDAFLAVEIAKPDTPLRRTEDDDMRVFFLAQKRF